MKKTFILLLSSVFLSPLMACHSLSNDIEKEALLNKSTVETTQEMTVFVTQVTQSNKVLIGKEELLNSSFLLIERVRLKDQHGLVMQGMETEEPHVFKLIKKNETCVLVHLKTNQRLLLTTRDCRIKI